jgi:hypothetical protein
MLQRHFRQANIARPP